MNCTPPSPYPLRHSRSAFTLTEVLVALAVLVISITLFLNSFVKAQQSALLVDDRVKAINFARKNLETLITNSYYNTDLNLTNRPNWVTNISVSANITSRYFCGYAVVTGQFSKSKTILLTNSWYDQVSRKTNSVTLSTAVCSGFLY